MNNTQTVKTKTDELYEAQAKQMDLLKEWIDEVKAKHVIRREKFEYVASYSGISCQRDLNEPSVAIYKSESVLGDHYEVFLLGPCGHRIRRETATMKWSEVEELINFMCDIYNQMRKEIERIGANGLEGA